MPTLKDSVVVKTIMWRLAKLYKFSSYKHAGLFKNPEPYATYQTPTNLRTGVGLQRESNINHWVTIKRLLWATCVSYPWPHMYLWLYRVSCKSSVLDLHILSDSLFRIANVWNCIY